MIPRHHHLSLVCPRHAGCAVVVSHDCYFLDRIATHIWHSRVIATASSSKGITPIMKKIKCRGLEKLASGELNMHLLSMRRKCLMYRWVYNSFSKQNSIDVSGFCIEV